MNTCVQTFVWMYVSILGGYIPRSGLPGGSVGKESACNVGDLGSCPGLGDPLEEGTATHSSILAWRISADRGTWRGTVHGVAEGNMTEGLSTHTREWGSPGGTEVKNLPANVGGTRDAGLIPRSGRSPGVGNGI